MKLASVLMCVAIVCSVSVVLWGRNGKSCAYGNRVYGDESFKINEAVCQQCKDGSWFDKADGACTATPAPTPEKPVKDRYSCEYDTGVYSNGAYHLNGRNCQRCGSGIFVDAPNSFCAAK